LRLAYVVGQKFSARAPCHVTCKQGVKNNHIFGILVALLFTNYATFMELRRRL